MSKFTLPLLLLAFTFIGCGSNFQPPSSSDPSTVSAAGPTITKKSFIGQIGPIPDTTVLTAPADGDYRVAIYVSAPKPANFNAGSINVDLSWTDENGPFVPGGFNPFVVSLTLLSDPMQRQNTFTIHAKSGTNIKVSGLDTTDTLNKYDAFVIVEPLQ